MYYYGVYLKIVEAVVDGVKAVFAGKAKPSDDWTQPRTASAAAPRNGQWAHAQARQQRQPKEARHRSEGDGNTVYSVLEFYCAFVL